MARAKGGSGGGGASRSPRVLRPGFAAGYAADRRAVEGLAKAFERLATAKEKAEAAGAAGSGFRPPTGGGPLSGSVRSGAGGFSLQNVTRGGSALSGMVSRMGGAGGIGRVVAASQGGIVGLSAALGPVGLAAGIVTSGLTAAGAALKGFHDSIQGAATAMREFGAAKSLSGGSSSEVAGLAARGIELSDLSGIAAELRNSVSLGTASPHSLMAGAKIGLPLMMPREWGGDTNEAAMLERAVAGLEKLSEKERLSVARQLPALAPILPKLNVSDDVRAAQKRDASFAADINTDEYIRAANDLGAATERVAFNFNTLIQAFGRTGFEPIRQGLMGLADSLQEVGRYLEQNPMAGRLLGSMVKTAIDGIAAVVRAIPAAIEGLQGMFTGFLEFIQTAYNMVRSLPGGNLVLPDLDGVFTAAKASMVAVDMMNKLEAAQQRAANAADRTGAALDKLGSAINEHAALIKEAGGGIRSRGAIPGKWKAEMMREAIKGQMLQLGPWSV